ncbi:DUF6481 family protein [Sphingomonas sp. LaA6.9]|uniref:DUF6481 family protein n=1 Tax=Sphingomonas sp. LaA6.9 TaxID=2919914 RepID=UPI001F4F2721|nr:DUF6481 family protein [Sphingomonas sp. LaA6.9]MCJ8157950.1 DUF6481 family protein [Sphingomonas sp. LaA6.9]
MRGFKEPGFNDRVAAANSAKAKALEMLKNKPKPAAGLLLGTKTRIAEFQCISDR